MARQEPPTRRYEGPVPQDAGIGAPGTLPDTAGQSAQEEKPPDWTGVTPRQLLLSEAYHSAPKELRRKILGKVWPDFLKEPPENQEATLNTTLEEWQEYYREKDRPPTWTERAKKYMTETVLPALTRKAPGLPPEVPTEEPFTGQARVTAPTPEPPTKYPPALAPPPKLRALPPEVPTEEPFTGQARVSAEPPREAPKAPSRYPWLAPEDQYRRAPLDVGLERVGQVMATQTQVPQRLRGFPETLPAPPAAERQPEPTNLDVLTDVVAKTNRDLEWRKLELDTRWPQGVSELEAFNRKARSGQMSQAEYDAEKARLQPFVQASLDFGKAVEAARPRAEELQGLIDKIKSAPTYMTAARGETQDIPEWYGRVPTAERHMEIFSAYALDALTLGASARQDWGGLPLRGTPLPTPTTPGEAITALGGTLAGMVPTYGLAGRAAANLFRLGERLPYVGNTIANANRLRKITEILGGKAVTEEGEALTLAEMAAEDPAFATAYYAYVNKVPLTKMITYAANSAETGLVFGTLGAIQAKNKGVDPKSAFVHGVAFSFLGEAIRNSAPMRRLAESMKLRTDNPDVTAYLKNIGAVGTRAEYERLEAQAMAAFRASDFAKDAEEIMERHAALGEEIPAWIRSSYNSGMQDFVNDYIRKRARVRAQALLDLKQFLNDYANRRTSSALGDAMRSSVSYGLASAGLEFALSEGDVRARLSKAGNEGLQTFIAVAAMHLPSVIQALSLRAGKPVDPADALLMYTDMPVDGRKQLVAGIPEEEIKQAAQNVQPPPPEAPVPQAPPATMESPPSRPQSLLERLEGPLAEVADPSNPRRAVLVPFERDEKGNQLPLSEDLIEGLRKFSETHPALSGVTVSGPEFPREAQGLYIFNPAQVTKEQVRVAAADPAKLQDLLSGAPPPTLEAPPPPQATPVAEVPTPTPAPAPAPEPATPVAPTPAGQARAEWDAIVSSVQKRLSAPTRTPTGNLTISDPQTKSTMVISRRGSKATLTSASGVLLSGTPEAEAVAEAMLREVVGMMDIIGIRDFDVAKRLGVKMGRTAELLKDLYEQRKEAQAQPKTPEVSPPSAPPPTPTLVSAGEAARRAQLLQERHGVLEAVRQRIIEARGGPEGLYSVFTGEHVRDVLGFDPMQLLEAGILVRSPQGHFEIADELRKRWLARVPGERVPPPTLEPPPSPAIDAEAVRDKVVQAGFGPKALLNKYTAEQIQRDWGYDPTRLVAAGIIHQNEQGLYEFNREWLDRWISRPPEERPATLPGPPLLEPNSVDVRAFLDAPIGRRGVLYWPRGTEPTDAQRDLRPADVREFTLSRGMPAKREAGIFWAGEDDVVPIMTHVARAQNGAELEAAVRTIQEQAKTGRVQPVGPLEGLEQQREPYGLPPRPYGPDTSRDVADVLTERSRATQELATLPQRVSEREEDARKAGKAITAEESRAWELAEQRRLERKIADASRRARQILGTHGFGAPSELAIREATQETPPPHVFFAGFIEGQGAMPGTVIYYDDQSHTAFWRNPGESFGAAVSRVRLAKTAQLEAGGVQSQNETLDEVRDRITEYNEARRLARAALETLSRGIPTAVSGTGVLHKPEQPSLLGLAALKDFETKGVFDPVGQKTETDEDVAVASQIARNPPFESLHLLLSKNGRVVQGGIQTYTSELPDFVNLPLDMVDVIAERLTDTAEQLGADTVHAVHNHTSGMPDPSGADLDWTHALHEALERLRQKGRKAPRFAGHVLIDEGTYGSIMPKPDVPSDKMTLRDWIVRVKPLPQGAILPKSPLEWQIPDPRLGLHAANREVIALAGRDLSLPHDTATLLLLSNDNRIRAIAPVSLDLLGSPDVIGHLAALKRATGGGAVIAYYPSNGARLAEFLSSVATLYDYGELFDYVTADDEGVNIQSARGIRKPGEQAVSPARLVNLEEEREGGKLLGFPAGGAHERLAAKLRDAGARLEALEDQRADIFYKGAQELAQGKATEAELEARVDAINRTLRKTIDETRRLVDQFERLGRPIMHGDIYRIPQNWNPLAATRDMQGGQIVIEPGEDYQILTVYPEHRTAIAKRIGTGYGQTTDPPALDIRVPFTWAEIRQMQSLWTEFIGAKVYRHPTKLPPPPPGRPPFGIEEEREPYGKPLPFTSRQEQLEEAGKKHRDSLIKYLEANERLRKEPKNEELAAEVARLKEDNLQASRAYSALLPPPTAEQLLETAHVMADQMNEVSAQLYDAISRVVPQEYASRIETLKAAEMRGQWDPDDENAVDAAADILSFIHYSPTVTPAQRDYIDALVDETDSIWAEIQDIYAEHKDALARAQEQGHVLPFVPKKPGGIREDRPPYGREWFGIKIAQRIAQARKEEAERLAKQEEIRTRRLRKYPPGVTVPLLEQPLAKKIGLLNLTQALSQYTLHGTKERPWEQERLAGPTQENLIGKEQRRKMFARLAQISIPETEEALRDENAATEWYGLDVKEMERVIGYLNPGPVFNSPEAMSLLKAFIAIMSGEARVGYSFDAGREAWEYYLRTGKMPLRRPSNGEKWGKYWKIRLAGMRDLDNLIKHFNGDLTKAMEWLLTPHPVKEIDSFKAGVTRTRLPVTEIHYGAMMLGPKYGPFFLNMHGITALTVDRWMYRLWNRVMGTGVENREIVEYPRSADEERLIKEGYMRIVEHPSIRKYGLTPLQFQAVAWKYNQDLMHAHGGKPYSGNLGDASHDLAERLGIDYRPELDVRSQRARPNLPGIGGPGAGAVSAGVSGGGEERTAPVAGVREEAPGVPAEEEVSAFPQTLEPPPETKIKEEREPYGLPDQYWVESLSGEPTLGPFGTEADAREALAKSGREGNIRVEPILNPQEDTERHGPEVLQFPFEKLAEIYSPKGGFFREMVEKHSSLGAQIAETTDQQERDALQSRQRDIEATFNRFVVKYQEQLSIVDRLLPRLRFAAGFALEEIEALHPATEKIWDNRKMFLSSIAQQVPNQDAEDIFHQALLRFLRAKPRLDPNDPEAPLKYMWSIVRSIVLDRYTTSIKGEKEGRVTTVGRKPRPQIEVQMPPMSGQEGAVDFPAPYKEPEHEMMLSWLSDKMELLTPEERRTLDLYLDEEGMREASRTSGVPYSTLRHRAGKVVEKLRRMAKPGIREHRHPEYEAEEGPAFLFTAASPPGIRWDLEHGTIPQAIIDEFSTWRIPLSPSATVKNVPAGWVIEDGGRVFELAPYGDEQLDVFERGAWGRIPVPELTELANELINLVREKGYVQVGRRLPKGTLGVFKPTKRELQIRPELFTGENKELLARVLAHEIGHLIDWFGHVKTIARGNLIGRLATLEHYMKNELGDMLATNKQLREELLALSQYWRPFPPSATKAYIKYRLESTELYADFISALFNSPGAARGLAPMAYREFHKRLDKKPEVKDRYAALRALFQGTPEELLANRLRMMDAMYQRAELVSLTFEKEDKELSRGKWKWLKDHFYDRGWEIELRTLEAMANGWKPPDENWNPRYLWDELTNKLVNREFMFFDKVNKEVYLPLEKIIDPLREKLQSLPIPPEYANLPPAAKLLGMYMHMHRAATQRAGLASPAVVTGQYAIETLNDLEKAMGPEAFQSLKDAAHHFSDIQWDEWIQEAFDLGIYPMELYDYFVENKYNYAKFVPVEHMRPYVTPLLHKQTGFLGDIENPFVSTLKMDHAGIRLVTIERVKQSVIDMFSRAFPEEIERARPISTQGVPTYRDRTGEGWDIVEVFRNGKRVAYYVDQYIANVLNRTSPERLSSVGEWIRNWTHKPFYNWTILYNLAFAAWSNPARDFMSNWRKLPLKKSILFGDLIELAKEYYGAAPHVYRYLKNGGDAEVEAMFRDYSYSIPMSDVMTPLLEGEEPDDYRLMLKKAGVIGEFETIDKGMMRRIHDSWDAYWNMVSRVGQFGEMTGKLAGRRIRIKYGESGKELALQVRRNTSTPPWYRRGDWTRTTNILLPYSNVWLQGILSEYTVATDPKTRSGWWLKMMKMGMLITFMKFMWDGLMRNPLLDEKTNDLIEAGGRKISRYMHQNYFMVPIGFKENGDPVTLSLPKDEMTRILSGIINGTIDAMRQQDPSGFTAFREWVLSQFKLLYSQFPSWNPAIGIVGAWTTYYGADRNPTDMYRMGPIMTEDAAREGGWEAAWQLVKYSVNQYGLTNIQTWNPEEKTWWDIWTQSPEPIGKLLGRMFRVGGRGEEQEKGRQIREKQRQEAISRRNRADAGPNTAAFIRLNADVQRDALLFKYETGRGAMTRYQAQIQYPLADVAPRFSATMRDLSSRQRNIDAISNSRKYDDETKKRLILAQQKLMESESTRMVELYNRMKKGERSYGPSGYPPQLAPPPAQPPAR